MEETSLQSVDFGASPPAGGSLSQRTPSLVPSEAPSEDQDSILLLERRSFRPFKNADDYLYAMREDLAEWLNGLYDLNITVDDFFERLENGVILCEHANNVRQSYEEHQKTNPSCGKKFSSRYTVPAYDVHYRRDSAPGSFFARDNVHNFIRWCRDLGVHDVLMFETDDLVLRKNEKHVILALLEIARRGARFGMAAPLLVQMEDDIDREIEKDRLALEHSQNGDMMMIGREGETIEWVEERTREENDTPPNLIYGPQPQVVTNDLLSLDEMVRDLVERCTCPSQFPMIKVSEGKYRIGDTKVLIFVRILRNHVMVRVGGGWDTLHHYLDKHDPCRCRSGHRVALSSKIGFKTPNGTDRHLSSVTYERSEEGYSSPLPRRRSNCFRRDSTEAAGRPSLRHRSQSPAMRENPSLLNTPNSPRVGFRGVPSKEENAASSPDAWCDSSSEVSDEGYKSQGPPRSTLRSRKPSPKKPLASDFSERPCSSMTHLSSDGSSASADDIVVPPSPPDTPPTATPFSSWNPGSSSQIPRCAPKNKLIPGEHLFANKPKSKSISQTGRKAWNAGPGLRPGENESRSRRSSISDAPDGRKISRSRSATSDGGFQTMLRKEPCNSRHFFRTGVNRPPLDASANKNTWNGRSRQRDYPLLNADAFRPPTGVRSVRSASASPAATRKVFTSAPSTPANRSPKRSNPSANKQQPPLPTEILNTLPDFSGDGDAEILAKLEGFVSNYRAYVLDKLAAEGRSPPPELAEEEWERESENAAMKDVKFVPLKANPRKAGLGSRIPAPVF